MSYPLIHRVACLSASLLLLTHPGDLPAQQARVIPALLRVAAPSDSSDSSAVVAVVAGFHRALARGDSASALASLAPDAIILESGGVESRHEYRTHHLSGDIAFARAVLASASVLQVVVTGDAAWVISTSTSEGTLSGRTVNSAGAELMVLSRSAGGRWLIRATHWSSRRRT